jgi:hypothetical protein
MSLLNRVVLKVVGGQLNVFTSRGTSYFGGSLSILDATHNPLKLANVFSYLVWRPTALVCDPLTIVGSFLIGVSAGALVTYAKQKRLTSESRNGMEPGLDPTNIPVSAHSGFAMNALVVGRDPDMIRLFSRLFAEKHIHTQACLESGALEQLSSDKFEAVVFDCDEFPSCTEILKSLPRPNKNVLVLALASASEMKQTLSNLGASFVVERPLQESPVRELMRQAYGRMLRDGQSYFRLTVQLPISVRRESGVIVQCTTLNVSQTGMAVNSTSGFIIGEEISIVFAIPNTEISVSGKGRIIWDDKHGKAGISFACTDTFVQARFWEWLHDQFVVTRQEVGGASLHVKETLAHVG